VAAAHAHEGPDFGGFVRPALHHAAAVAIEGLLVERKTHRDGGVVAVALAPSELGITSLKELERAARKDRIKGVKGLGAALQTKILRNLEISRSAAGRLHIHRAASLLENAQATLRQTHPELTRITSAGDFRRGCELVGDFAVMAQAPALEEGQTVLRGGGTLTVHLSDAAHYGAALLFATGSQAHLEALQSLAVQTRASMVDIVRGEGKVQFGGLKGHWIGTQAGVLQGLHDRRANLVGLRFGGQEDVLSTLLEFSGLRERPGGFPRPRPLSLRARFSLSSRAIEARGGSRVRDRADSRPRWCEHGFRFGNDKRPKSRGVPSS
jgi:hypothetical protein